MDIREVVKMYLSVNPEIRMKEDTMKRIYAFLSGKYYLTVDEAIETGGDEKTCK